MTRLAILREKVYIIEWQIGISGNNVIRTARSLLKNTKYINIEIVHEGRRLYVLPALFRCSNVSTLIWSSFRVVDLIIGPYICLVVARDNFLGWPEAKPMKNPTSDKTAKFIWEDLIRRYEVFREINVDGEEEFKRAGIQELNKLDIKWRIISVYNSKANGMIERGHLLIVKMFFALSEGGKLPWLKYLATVLLAIRTTIHISTGYTPFSILYGKEPVLPIETRYPT